MNIKWILLSRLAEMSGYTVKALERKIEDGVFTEGIHYRHSPDRRIHFSIEAYERWVEGDIQALKSTVASYASTSSTEGGVVARR